MSSMITTPLIKKIEAAGLLGRGCGTFPTALKWSTVLNTKADEKYVICNCSESEPGIFKDEFILDHYPQKVLDGVQLAIDTFKAAKAFIYLNPAYYARFRNKLQVLIGDDNIEIFAKPVQDYIGGEESAIVSLMQGEREQPKIRPPFVTTHGFLDKPTLVNNSETFHDISLINDNRYNHQRFFSISGHQTPKGVFHLPENLSVKEALMNSGHYPSFPFFVQLGGAMAGTCLRADQLKDYTIQHYSGLVVHPLDADEKKLINRWLSFFASESCGQCVTCREGTYRLHQLYQAKKMDSDLFADIIFSMQRTSFCSLGKMAVTALTSYYENIKKQPLNINAGPNQAQKCNPHE